MILTVIGTLMVGVSTACFAYIIARLFRRKLPRGMMAAIGGATMLGYIVWTDFTWFERVTAPFLREQAVILSSHTNSSFLRPWTLLRPTTDRFMVLGTRGRAA